MSADTVPTTARRPWRFGLRAQGLAVALVLLVVFPLVHEHYVGEMRARLQQAQQRALLDVTEAYARTLQPLSDPVALVDPVAERLPGASIARSGFQVWLLDTELQVRGHWGSLVRRDTRFMADADPQANPQADALDRWIVRWVHPWVAPDTVDFSDLERASGPVLDDAVRAAAQGSIGVQQRSLATRDARIFSVAAPVWGASGVEGVVVVEQGDDTITRAAWHARERLAVTTLLAFLVVAGVLALYAGRLTRRLLALQAEAESAVDAQGRVRRSRGLRLLASHDAEDELGDLSRSFSTLLQRLDGYHDYLQKLARLLGHELRTPITSIRMSLDNLRALSTTPADAVYFERTERGMDRINRVLSAMGEASRLEEMLASSPRIRFDLGAFLHDYVNTFAASRPDRIFEVCVGPPAAWVLGDPDWAAQMLDKLLSNACDFAVAGTPIVVACERDTPHARQVRVSVSNQGPRLPAALATSLFEPFSSVRDGAASDQPHLGIGLHVVRLVAEYHGGQVAAQDRADGSGVVFTVTLPLEA